MSFHIYAFTHTHTLTHTHIHTQVGDPDQVKLVSSSLGRATLHSILGLSSTVIDLGSTSKPQQFVYFTLSHSLGNDGIDFVQSMCQINQLGK